MPRKARAAPPKDQAPSDAASAPTESGAAAQPLRLVWKADGSPLPDKLEKGALPYLSEFHHGCMCANAGQHEMALGFFQKAVDLKPDFAEAHCNLGVALARLGPSRRSRALTELGIAVSLNSKFFWAASNLWMLLRGDELLPKLEGAVGRLELDYYDAQNSLGPLAKYLATNAPLTRALEALAGTQHDNRRFDVVLEHFDRQLTPEVIERVSDEEAKYAEAQQTFGFPERPWDYFRHFVLAPDLNAELTLSQIRTKATAARRAAEILKLKLGYYEHYTPEVDGEKRTSASVREITDRHQLQEPQQRQNSDLVSPETVHHNAVPGEPTTPAGAAGQPRSRSALPAPEAGHEVTRPAASAVDLNAVAVELGLSFEDGERALQLFSGARSEATVRAGQVFRDIPEGLARPYSKDPVPDDVLTPDNVSIAYRIQNAQKRGKSEAKLIDPADKYLAGRIVRAHEKRLESG